MANYNSSYTGAQIDAGIGKADIVISGWIAPGKLLLSNNSGSVTDTINISAGSCADSTGVYTLTLASAMTKDVSEDWAAGSGNGGLDPDSTWNASKTYHCHIIKNPTTSAVDVFFSESLTPTLPNGYTLRRHISSVVTDGDTAIIGVYSADGNYYAYSATQYVFNATTGIPTTRTTYSAALPTGYAVRPIIYAQFRPDNTDRQNVIIGKYINDVAGSEDILLDTVTETDTEQHLYPFNDRPYFSKSTGQIDFRGAKATATLYIVAVGGYICNREAFV